MSDDKGKTDSGASSKAKTATAGTSEDAQRKLAQRDRNDALVEPPAFSGDTDELLAAGVPRQLIEGNDPDARLID